MFELCTSAGINQEKLNRSISIKPYNCSYPAGSTKIMYLVLGSAWFSLVFCIGYNIFASFTQPWLIIRSIQGSSIRKVKNMKSIRSIAIICFMYGIKGKRSWPISTYMKYAKRVNIFRHSEEFKLIKICLARKKHFHVSNITKTELNESCLVLGWIYLVLRHSFLALFYLCLNLQIDVDRFTNNFSVPGY